MPTKKTRGTTLPPSLPILELAEGGRRRESGRVLERGKLTAREWRFVLEEAANPLNVRLCGVVGVEPGECQVEHVFGDGERIPLGGCGAKESRVCVSQVAVHPEVVAIRYRCAACGKVDEDVAD